MSLKTILFLATAAVAAQALTINGLADKPAMGWNTWNKYAETIDEGLIRRTADALVSSGLASAGYVYVNLDDTWQGPRDPMTKRITADPQRFPSGMKALGEYIHSKGLKFGIYSSAGTKTCAGREGSLNYESQDAASYAEWGVDYLKYDNCFNEGQSGTLEKSFARYKKMSDALKATGRPIYYSMCNWGEDLPWLWANTIAQSWRTTGDIGLSWEAPSPYCPCNTTGCMPAGAHCSVMNILDKSAKLDAYGGPNKGWNDLDMLEVGNGGMNTREQLSHFMLWAALKSPLILGNDVTSMTPEDKRILMAREIIAVNQDALGVPAKLVVDNNRVTQIYAGPVVGGTVAVLLNRSDKPIDITAQWTQLGLSADATVAVRDIFARKDLGSFTGSFTAKALQPHGALMITLK
ncbi:alpha-galactosidase [Powellomyces hirtus]|uniref:Alpha-galactosidase n=1 Tax=Powellomyces hirtus TaxID=109895 RepID=A0A507E6Z2_9FUNG|nr:alpha-galactosidase [Powellomyces hirtus]